MPFTLKLRMLSSAIMSLLLAALMTAWVTWLNVGFAPDFLARWVHAYVCAWPAAFVIVMLIGPMRMLGTALGMSQRAIASGTDKSERPSAAPRPMPKNSTEGETRFWTASASKGPPSG